MGNGAVIDAAGLDRAFHIRPGAHATVTGLTVTGGDLHDEGGGVLNEGTLILSTATVTGNHAVGGGAIANYGDLTLTESTLSGNSASSGGGALYALGAITRLTNSTVSGNASGEPGAVYAEAGEITLDHVTVTANTGGGLGVDSVDYTIINTVVAHQTSGQDCENVAPLSGGYNMASDGSCALSAVGDVQNSPALLGPLADNGGTTETHLPDADSPSVDRIPAGTNGCGTTLASDQRGEVRPLDGDGDGVPACDVGAVERPALAQLTLEVDTPDDGVDGSPGDSLCATADGQCTLRAAIQETNAWPATDTIVVGDDVHPVLTRLGRDENAASTGDLDIHDRLTIHGGGATVDAAGIDRVFEVHDDGDATITDATIGGGHSFEGGGAIQTSGRLRLVRTTVVGNEAYAGGGVSAEGGVELSIVDSTIRDNVSHNIGGAVYAFFVPTAIENTTISFNTSGEEGGAVFYEAIPPWLTTLRAVTLAFNEGGSLGADGPIAVQNSIIANGAAGPACVFGVPISLGHNVIDDASCALGGPGDQQNVEPLLALLAYNGGPTPTHLPAASSPVVDAIPQGAAGCGTTLATDQRGVVRPLDGDGDGTAACDIGAVERPTLVPLALAVDTADDATDASEGDGVCATAAGTCSLRAAVQETNAWPTLDVITIAENVNPTLALAATSGHESASGDLDIMDALTIHGGGATISTAAAWNSGVIEVWPGATVNVEHLTITGGTATGVLNRGELSLHAVTITGNTGDTGGAIRNMGGVLEVVDSTLSGNTAATGGGLRNDSGGITTVVNSTISGNQASSDGSALFNTGSGTITATFVTITANTSPAGTVRNASGGVVTFTASIIADQLSGSSCSGTGTVSSGGYNIASDLSCVLVAPGDLHASPAMIGALADNGGPTLTHMPLVGSPTIDRVPVGAVGCGTTIVSDQRGLSRPVDGDGNSVVACDAGAVER